MTTTIRVTQPDGTERQFDDFDDAWELYSSIPGASWDMFDPAYLARFTERN